MKSNMIQNVPGQTTSNVRKNWLIMALLSLCLLWSPYPLFAHMDCTTQELARHSKEMAQLTLYAVQGGGEITSQVFEQAWGSNLPHEDQFRCSLRNMSKDPHFVDAGQVYRAELARLDPNLPDARLNYAESQYVDFLMWQKSQDANVTESPNVDGDGDCCI